MILVMVWSPNYPWRTMFCKPLHDWVPLRALLDPHGHSIVRRGWKAHWGSRCLMSPTPAIVIQTLVQPRPPTGKARCSWLRAVCKEARAQRDAKPETRRHFSTGLRWQMWWHLGIRLSPIFLFFSWSHSVDDECQTLSHLTNERINIFHMNENSTIKMRKSPRAKELWLF